MRSHHIYRTFRGKTIYLVRHDNGSLGTTRFSARATDFTSSTARVVLAVVNNNFFYTADDIKDGSWQYAGKKCERQITV